MAEGELNKEDFMGPIMPEDVLAERNPEQAWLKSKDPRLMSELLEGMPRNNRKERLFVVAFCRRILELDNFEDDDALRKLSEAVLMAEQYADSQVSVADMRRIRDESMNEDVGASEIRNIIHSLLNGDICNPRYLVSVTNYFAINVITRKYLENDQPISVWMEHQLQEEGIEADMMRDIFNPFVEKPKINPAWLEWQNGLILKMAQKIYDERKFEDLPILADALVDANHDIETEMSKHLRQPGPHVRGCWVLDLILGKE